MATGRNFAGQKGAAAQIKQEVFRPPVIDYLDMPREKMDFIVEVCENVLRMYNNREKNFYFECAEEIKKALDENYGQTYHVVVGKDFGSFFEYETGVCLQMWIDQHCFLVFKHG